MPLFYLACNHRAVNWGFKHSKELIYLLSTAWIKSLNSLKGVPSPHIPRRDMYAMFLGSEAPKWQKKKQLIKALSCSYMYNQQTNTDPIQKWKWQKVRTAPQYVIEK